MVSTASTLSSRVRDIQKVRGSLFFSALEMVIIFLIFVMTASPGHCPSISSLLIMRDICQYICRGMKGVSFDFMIETEEPSKIRKSSKQGFGPARGPVSLPHALIRSLPVHARPVRRLDVARSQVHTG